MDGPGCGRVERSITIVSTGRGRADRSGRSPAESSPPPKAAYSLLHRPGRAAADGLAVDALPRRLGEAALLFGRQTDREARFEMAAAADELSDVERIIREAAGDSIDAEPQREVIGQRSASHKLVATAGWLPAGVSGDQARALMTEWRRNALLNRWPDLKLGVLGGPSPREAAAEPGSRPRLAAAVMVMESIWEDSPWDLDFAELRSRLGLPVPAAIELHGESLAMLPAVRLPRLLVAGLSDDDLSLVFGRAHDLAIRAVQRNFAQAIIDRPSFAGSEERLLALATMARTEEDVSEALRYCDQGRREVEAKGLSNVAWDLMELSFQCIQRKRPRGHAADRAHSKAAHRGAGRGRLADEPLGANGRFAARRHARCWPRSGTCPGHRRGAGAEPAKLGPPTPPSPAAGSSGRRNDLWCGLLACTKQNRTGVGTPFRACDRRAGRHVRGKSFCPVFPLRCYT